MAFGVEKWGKVPYVSPACREGSLKKCAAALPLTRCHAASEPRIRKPLRVCSKAAVTRTLRLVSASIITQTAQNSQYAQSWASSSRRDDARGQRGRERAAVATDDNSRAAVAPDDNSTYNQPELRRDDDAADHLAAVVAATAVAVLAAVSPQRE